VNVTTPGKPLTYSMISVSVTLQSQHGGNDRLCGMVDGAEV
jgi:hypothetical protein